MKQVLILGLAVLLLTSGAVRAGAELTLQDGMVVSGTSVERTKEGVYQLTRTDGSVIIIPVELVKKLHLSSDEEPLPTGVRKAEAGSEAIVGPRVEPPKAREQLAAFGRPPARFQPGAVRTSWTPTNSLGPDVTNFSPVHWFEPPVQTSWTPTSAFSSSTDVSSFSPVHWFQGPVDTSWRPTSGFRPAPVWFSGE